MKLKLALWFGKDTLECKQSAMEKKILGKAGKGDGEFVYVQIVTLHKTVRRQHLSKNVKDV